MHICTHCEGRPRVVTSPIRGANRYKNSSRKTKRTHGAKTFGTGGAFSQACVVCCGTGTLFVAVDRYAARFGFDHVTGDRAGATPDRSIAPIVSSAIG